MPFLIQNDSFGIGKTNENFTMETLFLSSAASTLQTDAHMKFLSFSVLSSLKALFLANNDKSLNNNLVFGPISTILGRKVDIVGQCVLNLYFPM